MPLEWYGPQHVTKITRAAEAGLFAAAEHILQESNTLVPHETGDLERSGAAMVQGNTGTVSYDTPYAVIQHERMDYAHSAGRQAKYLETATDSNAGVVQRLIGEKVRRASGG